MPDARLVEVDGRRRVSLGKLLHPAVTHVQVWEEPHGVIVVRPVEVQVVPFTPENHGDTDA